MPINSKVVNFLLTFSLVVLACGGLMVVFRSADIKNSAHNSTPGKSHVVTPDSNATSRMEEDVTQEKSPPDAVAVYRHEAETGTSRTRQEEEARRIAVPKRFRELNGAERLFSILRIRPDELREAPEVESRRQTSTGKAFSFGNRGFIEFSPDMTKVITYLAPHIEFSENMVDRSIAMEKVRSAIQISGVSVGDDDLELVDRLDKTPQNTWRYFGNWVYKGIDTSCGVLVSVDSLGNIVSIKALPMIPPDEITPKLSKEEAVTIASEYLDTGSVPSKAYMTICRRDLDFASLPNDFDTPFKSEQTYLAWTIDYGDVGFQFMSVSVDARNGDILGQFY